MQHAQALEAVRHVVRRVFAELGAKFVEPMSEHILVRHDVYCGRRLLADGLQAIWFIEEDQIKIHGKDGSVVRVMSVEDAMRLASPTDKRAA